MNDVHTGARYAFHRVLSCLSHSSLSFFLSSLALSFSPLSSGRAYANHCSRAQYYNFIIYSALKKHQCELRNIGIFKISIIDSKAHRWQASFAFVSVLPFFTVVKYRNARVVRSVTRKRKKEGQRHRGARVSWK